MITLTLNREEQALLLKVLTGPSVSSPSAAALYDKVHSALPHAPVKRSKIPTKELGPVGFDGLPMGRRDDPPGDETAD